LICASHLVEPELEVLADHEPAPESVSPSLYER
jgi:hypothetical protein